MKVLEAGYYPEDRAQTKDTKQIDYDHGKDGGDSENDDDDDYGESFGGLVQTKGTKPKADGGSY